MKNKNTGVTLLGIAMPLILCMVVVLVIIQITFLSQVLGCIALVVCLKMRYWRSAITIAMFLLVPYFPMLSGILFAINIVLNLKGAIK